MNRIYLTASVATLIAATTACGSKQQRIDDKVEEQLQQSAVTVIEDATTDTTITLAGKQQNYVSVERIFNMDTTNQYYLSARVIVPAGKSGVTQTVSDIVVSTYKSMIDSAVNVPETIDSVGSLENTLQRLGNNFAGHVQPFVLDTVTPGFMINFDLRPVSGEDNYVTYAVYNDSYTGGAHGNIETYYTTLALPSGRAYTFDTLLKGPKAQTAVRKLLVEAIANTKSQTPDEYIASVKDFVGDENMSIDNFPVYHVALIPEGMVFSYPKYTIAAGFEGCPTYVIPTADVADYLSLSK